MRKKVLFIANHRLDRSPGQRFRFEQYLDFLEANGYDWELSNIISENDDGILYQKGKLFQKAVIGIKSWAKRWKDTNRADQFDIIFIFREALLTGSVFFEKRFSESKAKVIFDFDDAIWLPNVSAGNKALQALKKPSKTDSIISCADMVFAGNQYLASFAEAFCADVKIVPTTINTNYHIRKGENSSDKICIGWTGTQTTLKYLEPLKSVFIELQQKYGDQIYFKVICDQPWSLDGIELVNEKWNKETEIEQLSSIDIGVMPLTEDAWSLGKCGFKGLQYMAMESAAILSPVGVNKEIIKHEKNGFLAETAEDWMRTLSLLIEDNNLRKQIGKEGRKTIEEKYSVATFESIYLKYFNALTEKKMEMKTTALTEKHIKLGARMVPFAGYNMPLQYIGLTQEHLAVRNSVGVFDVSHMGEFIIRGNGALELIQKISTNDASKLVPGKVQYSCMPNGKGGIVDDLLIYMMDDSTYMLVVNASNIEKDWQWISSNNSFGAEMMDISDKTTLLAVQGPRAIAALQSLTSVNLEEMKYYTFERGTFAGYDNVIISATGYTGSGGFELYFDNAHADKIWDKIFKAGESEGIMAAGLGCRDTLRLEKGFCLYGNDIDDTTSPIEAGLGWVTKFTKDFIDSKTFEKQKENGVTKKLVGFKMEDRGIPRQHYKVMDAEGNEIGEVTSGTSSPSLKIGLGLAYVKTEFAKPDTEIFINIRDKAAKAVVAKTPFL